MSRNYVDGTIGRGRKKNPSLVGGLEQFFFSHILGIVIPIDFHIFQIGIPPSPCPPTTLLRSAAMQIHPVPTMEIRLLYDDYVPWLNLRGPPRGRTPLFFSGGTVSGMS